MTTYRHTSLFIALFVINKIIVFVFKIKDDNERKTLIEVATDKTARLPVRDIAVYDGGDDGEKFGLEIGPVCFS